MKKVLFTTMSIIAVAAMMFVSCKKEVTKTDGDEQKQETVDPELVGTWTIVGEANGWDQTAGVAMTESNNVWTVAEVAVKGEGFKFVKDGSWDINLGAVEEAAKEDNVEFDLEKNGKNIRGAKDGVYSVTLNLLTKKAKIAFVKDLEPEGPADVETFDYTPSAEYLAETNLWKAADADPEKTIGWFYNPNWAGEKAAPKTMFYQSTYYVELEDADEAAEWTTQMKIKPANFVLDPAKYYRFTCKVTSSTGTNVFIKMYHDGVDWPESFETPPVPNRIHVEAGETKEIEVKAFQPLDNNQILLIDFANHAANNVIHVKDIIIEETEEPAKVLAVTESILPEASYPTINTVVSAATGEEFYVYNVATFPAYGGKIQMKKNGSFFANRTSFGTIQSIKITNQHGKGWYPTNLKMYAGTAELPETTEIAAVDPVDSDSTSVYDFSKGNYQYFTLKNTSGYAVYLQEIEITYKGGATTPAMVLDGNFDEWTNIGAFTTTNERVTSWKAASDANSIYIYAVCPASVVKERGIWNAYIDGAFDLDNNEETGDAASYSLGNGMEAAFVAFPFSNAAGEDPAFVNGEKSDSWIKYPVSTAVGKVTSFGKVDGDNTLVELAIPRNLIGNPASGSKIAINIGMGTSPVGKQTLILK